MSSVVSYVRNNATRLSKARKITVSASCRGREAVRMSGDGFALVAKAENSKGIHNMLSAIHLKKDIVRMPLPLSSEETGILFLHRCHTTIRDPRKALMLGHPSLQEAFCLVDKNGMKFTVESNGALQAHVYREICPLFIEKLFRCARDSTTSLSTPSLVQNWHSWHSWGHFQPPRWSSEHDDSHRVLYLAWAEGKGGIY